MKWHLAICFWLVSITSTFAQSDEYKEPSKESQAYHEYRLYVSEPPYGLAKIKRLLINMEVKEDEESMGGTEKIPAKIYGNLSLREKFTYHMLHGETFSQICDAYPPEQDENKKIYGYLPDILREKNWSESQIKFLKDNRDSVIVWLKDCISRNNRAGVNFKRAILELDAVEMIPFLIKTYNVKKKDWDILTVFMLLMRKHEFDPFVKSTSFRKLYGKEYNFTASLVYNKANETLIISRVTEFYNGLSSK